MGRDITESALAMEPSPLTIISGASIPMLLIALPTLSTRFNISDTMRTLKVAVSARSGPFSPSESSLEMVAGLSLNSATIWRARIS